MIGVQVQPVPRDSYTDLGLKERRGALVAMVSRGGPAQEAGMQAGDVIIEVNSKPVASRDELVQTIMALKPGTTVPVKVIRDKEDHTLNVTIGELNLDRESDTASNETEPGDDDASAGFGMSLGNLTAERARRLELPAGTTGAVILEVDPAGAAARSGIAEGDVILRVNRQKVTSAAEANRELQRVQSGGTAFLLIWRRNQEVFVPLKKD